MTDLPDEYDDHDYRYDDQTGCWNCGGDGFVSNCFQEFACLYPDEGCDDCTRRCDVCHPLTPAEIREREALRQVLADALANQADDGSQHAGEPREGGSDLSPRADPTQTSAIPEGSPHG